MRIHPLFLLPFFALASLHADVLTSFTVDGTDVQTPQITWSNLGGAVAIAASSGGTPIINGAQNTFSQSDATGSIRVNMSAKTNNGGNLFHPEIWAGGVTTEIHSSSLGWGVPGNDPNTNFQAGEAIFIQFDLSSLNLGPGDKLVWTQANFNLPGSSGKADVWRKRAGESQGWLVSHASGGLSKPITIADGDTFALMLYSGNMRLVEMRLDIVPENFWESDIVYYDQNGRLTYEANENGQRIVDFSHAGYRAGAQAIPNVPVKHTISPISGDNTAHIQNAIDIVAAMPLVNGYRGAVLLQAGTYPVSGIVYIHTNGVVLRGVGQNPSAANNTIIRATGTNSMKELGTIMIKSSIGVNRKEAGTEQDIVSEFIPAGSRSLEVENGSMYSVGDYMVIEHKSTHEWLMAVNYGNTYGDPAEFDVPPDGWGDKNREDMYFHGTIVAIDGNKIKLDTPIYHEIDRSLAQATIYRHPGTGIVQESGVENLRVEIQSAGGQDESHRWDAVHFKGARNCWAKDVTAEGFAESGFRFSQSARSTAINCSALDPVATIQGGRRYNFYIGEDTHDILVKQCRATYGRHCFVGNGAAGTNGIVFTQSTSDYTYSSSENHLRWGSAFLWDSMTWSNTNTGGTVLALYNRGDSGTAHGWTGTGFVAWNVVTWGQNNVICSEPPIGQNFSVGGDASVTGQNYPAGHVEYSNREMDISSLYEAQLADRLAHGIGPDMPGRVRVSHYTNTAPRFVVVEWLDIALQETAYVVERSTNGGNTYSVLATLPANSVSYTDATVAQNGTYTYRVSATNSNGRSAYSNPVTIALTSVELPEAITYQPLDNVAQNECVLLWDKHGFTGKRYVDMGGMSSWFEMDVDGGKGGPTKLSFRYALSNATARPCNVLVDGNIAGSVNFVTTGSWDSWGFATVTVNLNRGINTIRVQPNSGAGGPNVDRMEVQATPIMYAAGETKPSYTAAMAFDTDNNTEWRHASPRGSWLQIAYPAAFEVGSYVLTSGSGSSANDPASWRLLGSNNEGVSWTVLDTRSGQTFSSRKQAQVFNVTNTGSYKLYRLDISSVRDLANANFVQLAEMAFIVGDLPPVTPNPAQFAQVPYATGETSISMTSVVGTSSFGAVEYYFDETSGNGNDSGWISSPTYTDVELTPGVQYTYTVAMRDSPSNQGGASSPQSAITYSLQTIDWNPPAQSDGLWSTGSNWSGGNVPLTVEQYLKVRFSAGAQDALLNTTAVVTQLSLGDSGSAMNRLRLADGANLTAGQSPFNTTAWTGIGFSGVAELTIDSGATLHAVGHLWIGHNATGVGTLIVNGGTVIVDQQLGLGWSGGTGFVELRNGTLHLDRLDGAQGIKGTSYINIESGTLIIEGDEQVDVNNYIAANKIRGFGGLGSVVIDYDAQNDQTTVTAISSETLVSFESLPTMILEGEDLHVRVNAADSDGIQTVYLYINGVQLSRSEGGAPYDFGLPGQNDTELENMQPGTYEIRARATDLLGNEGEATQTVTVLESVVKINFQPAASAIPTGYLADVSAIFGPRGNGFNYGWGSSFNVTRDRGVDPDQRYDTLNHTQDNGADQTWEIQLENGEYLVNLTGGDPSFADSFIEFVAEEGTPYAVTLMSGLNAGINFLSGSASVTVSDGRLTISNGPNAVKNKICFIDIYRISVQDPYEAWKTTHSITNDLEDEDGDGINNLLEFALGGDPTDGDSGQLPEINVNGSNLDFKFQRQEASITYVIEKSTDLDEWDLDYVTVSDVHGVVGTEATVSVPSSESNDGKLFLRLRVETSP